jgi:hypothetical protein
MPQPFLALTGTQHRSFAIWCPDKSPGRNLESYQRLPVPTPAAARRQSHQAPHRPYSSRCRGAITVPSSGLITGRCPGSIAVPGSGLIPDQTLRHTSGGDDYAGIEDPYFVQLQKSRPDRLRATGLPGRRHAINHFVLCGCSGLAQVPRLFLRHTLLGVPRGSQWFT